MKLKQETKIKTFKENLKAQTFSQYKWKEASQEIVHTKYFYYAAILTKVMIKGITH